MTKTVRALFLLALVPMLAACGGKKAVKSDLAAATNSTIGVNSYLWRASLDTLAFMPLTQVDSSGGVIVTDWYISPQSPNERVKVTVSILDKTLRADALRVAAIRQEGQNGLWVDVPVRAGTVQKLEEAILGRARDIRHTQISDKKKD